MYPNEIIAGMGLYEICIVAGIFAGMLAMRRISERCNIPARFFNFILACVVPTIIGGYLCAFLMQAVYNALETGSFVLDGTTGSTFLGGLFGGTAIFFICYFGVGKIIWKNRETVRYLPFLLDGAAVFIPTAHAFGRIGCFFAGCCYGKASAYGVYMASAGEKVLPVQLWEAAFLACLAIVLSRLCGRRMLAAPVYLTSYGTWRFVIEYFRGDDRGKTIVSFLTPSQLAAVIMIICGTLWLILRAKNLKNEK